MRKFLRGNDRDECAELECAGKVRSFLFGEFHHAVHDGVDGVVFASTGADARVDFGATLTNDNFA